jgi:two-component sensor histidine kinase
VTISPLTDPAGRIIGASKIARDITDRKRAEETLRLLAEEVDHRSKNLLALVQATVHFSNADTADAIKKAIDGRIRALSNVHTLLAQSRWAGANLHRLVMDELRPYCPPGTSRAEVNGPDLMLKPQSAQLIAMMLHELTTNAVKYGALSVSSGRVRIAWSEAADGKLLLRWTEIGGPAVQPPTRQGFGTRVLDRAVRGQMKWEMRFDWRAEGLACEIEVQT